MQEAVTSLETYQAARHFWTTQVADFHLTTSQLLPPGPPGGNATRTFNLPVPPELAARLLEMTKQNDLLLYVLLLSALDVVFFRYTGSRDVTIGAPPSTRGGRDHVFNDWIFLRTRWLPDMPVRRLLDENRKVVKEAYQNQHYPLASVFASPGLEEHRDFHPRILLALSSLHGRAAPGHTAQVRDGQMFFMVERDGGALSLSLCHDARVFEPALIEQVGRHYLSTCGDMVSRKAARVEDLECLSPGDRNKLLSEWNDTERRFGTAPTLHAAFESVAGRHPRAIAVVADEASISYWELDAKADALAAQIREAMAESANPSGLVGLYLQPSIELVIGVLATLKAGSAFVPFSRSQPDARIRFMLEDASIRVLLADADVAERFAFGGRVLPARDFHAPVGGAGGGGRSAGEGGDRAWVIYTSGSTGAPKGVVVEHEGALNSSLWRISALDLQPHDRMLNLASHVCDGFYSFMFSMILSGGTVVLRGRAEHLDPDRVNGWVQEHAVTSIALIPSLYEILLDRAGADRFASLRFALLAAESTTASLIARSLRLAPHVTLVNEYGPTENSVVSLAHFGMDADNPGVVGTPISNTQAYVLGPELSLLPPGVIGEICVSGMGLARGYLNRPDLTAERFVPHPFRANQRLYRTGDLGRYRGDGSIEFHGRSDGQLKIRGHRVEIGEVERCIEGLPGIRRARVVPYRNGIAAYYVATEPGLDGPALRCHLETLLPPYMIPAVFVALREFPLNASGKVDPSALPQPGEMSPSPGDRRAPATEKETLLAGIWEAVLGRPGLGIDDNFFDVGGDSIRALQVIAAVRQQGYECSIQALLDDPTIGAFSRQLKKGASEISQAPVEGPVALTPIQKWLFEQPFDRVRHFNQSVMLVREAGFEAHALHEVFTALVGHHDALRMIYRQGPGGIEQVNRAIGGPAFTLRELDLRSLAPAEAEATLAREAGSLQQSIDLSEGPLVRLALCRTARGDHLLIVIHHLVVDGYSWRILLEDLQTAYRQVLQNVPVALPPKTSSFQAWAERLSRYARSQSVAPQAGYWHAAIGRMPQPARAASAPGPAYRTLAAAKCVLKAGTARRLVEAASKVFDTGVDTLLLAALGLAYRKCRRLDRVAVCVEGHGREALFDDVFLGRTVGWFTSQYPVLLRVPSDDCGVAITLTRAALEEIPNRGVDFGILKYLDDSPANAALRGLQAPRVLFNYLGHFAQGVAPEPSPFRLSHLSVGGEIHPDWEAPFDLSIGVTLAGGEADVSLQHDPAVISSDDVREFSTAYAALLEEIAAESLRDRLSRPAIRLSEAAVRREYYSRDRPGLPKLFFFPPKMSLGLSYYSLAQYVGNAELVAFDFIARETRLLDYIDYITAMQPAGPYVLGGYSSAALVLEVARTMQERNLSVRDIILFDARPGDASGDADVSEERTADSIEFFVRTMRPFAANLDDDFVQATREKINAHARFIRTTRNVSPIDATLHFVQSQDSLDEDIRMCRALSLRELRLYEGSGEHSFMLSGSAARSNAEIICAIVNSMSDE